MIYMTIHTYELYNIDPMVCSDTVSHDYIILCLYSQYNILLVHMLQYSIFSSVGVYHTLV